MIYKCDICGADGREVKECFETSSAVLFIEHLEEHLNTCYQIMDENDEEIERLKKLKISPSLIGQIAQPKKKVGPWIVTEEKYVEQEQEQSAKPKRTRIPFDDNIKKILTQYSDSETIVQLQTRIHNEVGRMVPRTSIYNWIAKNKKFQ